MCDPQNLYGNILGKSGEVHGSDVQAADWKCFARDKSVRNHMTKFWIDAV